MPEVNRLLTLVTLGTIASPVTQQAVIQDDDDQSLEDRFFKCTHWTAEALYCSVFSTFGMFLGLHIMGKSSCHNCQCQSFQCCCELRSRDQDYINRVRACCRAYFSFDCQLGGQAVTMWSDLVHMCFPEFGTSTCLENMLAALVDRCMFLREHASPRLFQFLEFFAGVGNLSRGLLQRGLHGAAFDVTYSSAHDVLNASGLRLYVDACLSSASKCLAWFAVQCSSFVGLCISNSKRGPENAFMGDQSREFVQVGNSLMIVTAFLLFLCRLCNITTCLEQPLNSCLPKCPAMSSVLQFCRMGKFVTYLGAFGGKSAKPLQIWTSSAAFSHLVKAKPEGLDGGLVTRSENGSYTGNKIALEESGVYPPVFGTEVAFIFDNYVN